MPSSLSSFLIDSSKQHIQRKIKSCSLPISGKWRSLLIRSSIVRADVNCLCGCGAVAGTDSLQMQARLPLVGFDAFCPIWTGKEMLRPCDGL